MKLSSQYPASRWRKCATDPGGAFSLVEILVTVAIIGVLFLTITAMTRSSMTRAKDVQCVSRVRSLASGILQYTQDQGEFPRSLHSASGAGKPVWAIAILPYIGTDETPTGAAWDAMFEKMFRCPADTNRTSKIYSYALNVHFELNPDSDDYPGSPLIWRRPASVISPGATILLAEPKAVFYADHIMSHQWTTARAVTNAIDGLRHGKKSNYAFADGHVETMSPGDTFNPAKGINLWNPSLARRQ
ncbi:prepilin-type processing-associated H-X9-DG domain-containing protein [Terrimicrobium sacchariphilum]|uniref:Prepilin-type processing-associated H-X9-DG domain-containing protein n=1 Tax=Terrimicrobium sacchariphilum TaxID=690879 RepID=A0A146G9X5_TERSA|nr:H-X9-DG-CTERM domain-containing protein [Terrimicrobium sacchariphilum]GAT34260.1 prepilin-type processing-associated H-X9-DG domain-containing protein [Terrimicrobium sacchariphilum]